MSDRRDLEHCCRKGNPLQDSTSSGSETNKRKSPADGRAPEIADRTTAEADISIS
jgi:hypothetical protein